MNILSPAQVAVNRTARLVAEAKRPVFRSETKPREHVHIVEIEADTGYRQWVSSKEAEELLATGFYFWSDEDHSTKCWCFK